MAKARATVARMMREVHEHTPSTVTRAKHFGPGGKEAMLRAIALSKAREAGAKVPTGAAALTQSWVEAALTASPVGRVATRSSRRTAIETTSIAGRASTMCSPTIVTESRATASACR